MRILVVGGSGLIGAHVVQVLRERGHTPLSAARHPGPGVDHVFELTSADPRPILAGCDGVVVATRTDEQKPLPKPIHPAFRRDMVDPVVRLFAAAREQGLTRGVLMGSYYTYFDRLHPQWRLAEHHTYIRCRVEQAREGRAAAGPELPVAVLELPFVFGRSGDRLPNWSAPLDRWTRSRLPLVAPPGGTAVTTARHVAEAAADALEAGSGADIPIADENLSWSEMIARIAAHRRPVHALPASVVKAALRAGGAMQRATRKESGINPAHAAGLLLTDLFVDPPTGRSVDAAIRESFPR
ncbi:NAD-dependent epimerase/dehydratase family protein [Actinoplanes sp. NPDC048796]|uniref:NAD-dependent epimerase/dehydratase family protein n=1 Tax=unclassified Actinoplanes TaxID=2626549 RepID=UPI0033DF8CDE